MHRLLDGTANTVGYARMIVDRGNGNTFLKPPRAIAPGEHMATYLLCDRGFVPTITVVVERGTAQRVRYSEDLRAAEDTDFAIRLFLDGQRFVMADAPGAVWMDVPDPNRTSSGRKGGRMIAWLEEMKPVIPARAYYGCRGWAIAKSVAVTDRAAALKMYLTAVLCGCYPRRLAGIVFLQIFLSDRAYRKVADRAISKLGAGARLCAALKPWLPLRSLSPIGSNRGKRQFPPVNGSSAAEALNRPKRAGEWLKSAGRGQRATPPFHVVCRVRRSPHRPNRAFSSAISRAWRERRALMRNVALATVVAATVVVLMLLPTMYTTSASVMLDPRKNNVADLSSVLSQLPTDPASLQNQIQILTSRDLATHVIAKLHLYDDPEFNTALNHSATANFLAAIDPRNWIRSATTPDENSARDKIVDTFLKNVSVSAEGLSTTLTVTFSSRDPAKAASIANMLVDTYIEDQIAANRNVGGKTTAWLVNRTQELAQQLQTQEAAVQRYKADHNLNETADGTSFADQQITAISNQLVLAKADLAEKQATSDRVQALMKAGDTADVSQILASPLIVQLRTQQGALIAQESDLNTKYGPRHPKMVAMETQKKDLQDKISTEVNRLAGSISNDVVVARAQVGSLQGSLAQAEKQAGTQNLVRVNLRALQSNAQSTRTMYEAFVTRLRETQDQDVIQTPDARVISRAPVPSAPSSPKRTLIFIASIPAGLMLGLLAALLAERLSGPVPVRVAPARAFRPVPQPVMAAAAGAGGSRRRVRSACRRCRARSSHICLRAEHAIASATGPPCSARARRYRRHDRCVGFCGGQDFGRCRAGARRIASEACASP